MIGHASGWISQSKSCSSAVTRPFRFVLAELAGVSGDASLHRQGVPAQAIGFGEFAEQLPGFFARLMLIMVADPRDILKSVLRVGLWRSWERASMAWKRS